MDKNVLEWLERRAAASPDTVCYDDGARAVTFRMVKEEAERIGAFLHRELSIEKESSPVCVMAGRSVNTIIAFLGVVYSGHCYAPIDAGIPEDRIRTIVKTAAPAAILADSAHMKRISSIGYEGQIYCIEDILSSYAEAADSAAAPAAVSFVQAAAMTVASSVQAAAPAAVSSVPTADPAAASSSQTQALPEDLRRVREVMCETDPLYIIFTSGSTGVPKGVITSHHSLMTYIDAYEEVMGIDETDRLGSQSPLDYIAAIRDIYLPLRTGCRTYLIPKEKFMEPDALFTVMNEQHITAVGWSVSAFTVPVSLGALGAFSAKKKAAKEQEPQERAADKKPSEGTVTAVEQERAASKELQEASEEEKFLRPQCLKKVCFSGSVMPGRVLRAWQLALPEARFVNQYGPTEATASCTYYPVDHVVSEEEVLPIGRPYRNYRIYLLTDDGRAAAPGEEGEICVAGPILALGYYNNPERTAQNFVQNPLRPGYRELIYKTGDYGVMRADGNLEFHGRRDRQIKHMGHRVELDEVDRAAMRTDGIKECCTVYNKAKEQICLFYTGDAGKREIALSLREFLPGFMIPRKLVPLTVLPKLPNGKTDMKALERMAEDRK